MYGQPPSCPKCRLFHDPGDVCSFDVLAGALAGVKLTPAEEKLVRWLAGSDQTETWAGLLARLAAAHNARDAHGRAEDAERAAQLLATVYAHDPHTWRARIVAQVQTAIRALHPGVPR